MATLTVALLGLLGACAAEPPAAEGLLLPAGDAEAGRGAFAALRCHTCHAVESDPQMPVPVSDNRGPDVGSLAAAESREQIALSIISPSHYVAPPRDSSMSHMGSFREVMTVQQLIDLTTWLKELNPTP